MADIAILVAEEYERRLRRNSKKQIGCDYEKIDLVSSVSIMAKRVDVSEWINQHVGDGISSIKMEIGKWILEPKTQIGVAASDGLFSA